MEKFVTQISEVRGKRILILGYGVEGRATHEFLNSHYPTAEIGIADKKLVSPLSLVKNIYHGDLYLTHLKDFDTVIRSPGISQSSPELQAFRKTGGYLTTATNIFFSLVQGKTIGVTGTKGKSTTASLITHILKEEFPDVRLVGNIGYPMLSALKGQTPQAIFIVELSSHQLDDCRYSPHAAVILDIVPEHLDYYKKFESYASAKARIISSQTTDDVVIFNPDSKTAANIAQKSAGQKLTFSTKKSDGLACWIEDNMLMAQTAAGPRAIIEIDKISLKGNRENILAATAAAVNFSVPHQLIARALSTFVPLPHRLEFVGVNQGIRFYNDSLATVPEATIHALEALGTNVETLIAGGFDRGVDYTMLGKFLAVRPGLKTLILFPDTGEKIWAAVEQMHKLLRHSRLDPDSISIKKFDVTSMEEAVKLAYRYTSPGKICLLSPASASFNLFRNYEDRGDQFKKLVAQKTNKVI